MRGPNFFLIGAAKSASSSLHYYLAQHPDIFMGYVKEPNFFAFEGGVPPFLGPDDEVGPWDGPRASRQRLRGAKYAESITRRRDYERLFRGVRGQRAVGESSVIYLYSARAAARIRRVVPQAKLVAVLRQPVERAFSKFLQFRKEGCEPLADFRAAVAAEAGRIRRGWSPTWHYLARGRYLEQLSTWLAHFPRERFHVLLYDDLAEDPVAAARSVYRFLGVDDGFAPDTSLRFMDYEAPTDRPRFRVGHWLLNEPNPIKSAFNCLVPRRSVRRPLRKVLLALNRKERVPWTKPALEEAVRRELTVGFRDDIERLQDLIERDLGHWLP